MNYTIFTGPRTNEIPYVKHLKREWYDEYHSLETWYETRYQELYWEVNNNLVEHLRTSNSLIVGRYDLPLLKLQYGYSEDEMKWSESQHFSYLWVKEHIKELRKKGYTVVEDKPLRYDASVTPFADIPLNNIVVTW